MTDNPEMTDKRLLFIANFLIFRGEQQVKEDWPGHKFTCLQDFVTRISEVLDNKTRNDTKEQKMEYIEKELKIFTKINTDKGEMDNVKKLYKNMSKL
jgi:hypothetical protein